jgi:hypothetical protein
MPGSGGLASARAEIVHSDAIEPGGIAPGGIGPEKTANADFAVSTRTYIVLAALTGLVILVAFAFQVILVNR